MYAQVEEEKRYEEEAGGRIMSPFWIAKDHVWGPKGPSDRELAWEVAIEVGTPRTALSVSSGVAGGASPCGDAGDDEADDFIEAPEDEANDE